MTRSTVSILLLAAAGVLLVGCRADQPAVSLDAYRSPLRFEKDIVAFEEADALEAPPAGAVVFTGSSSVRMWHPRLAGDMEPLTVIGRGFGGSNMNDLLHYADRVMLKVRPRAVVIYEGDNDIAQGVEPEAVARAFELLLDKIEGVLPGCRVYVLSVKPSLRRWAMWPKMQAVNGLLAGIADDRRGVTFVDVATPLMGADGRPRPELFVRDGLHLNRAGYEVWRDAVRPVVVDAERGYEE